MSSASSSRRPLCPQAWEGFVLEQQARIDAMEAQQLQVSEYTQRLSGENGTHFMLDAMAHWVGLCMSFPLSS